MKTFEQCCDEVAKKRNMKDRKDYAADCECGNVDPEITEEFYTEAAELYREEGIKEAVKLARECYNESIGNHKRYTEQEIFEKLKL